jgi:hypothetical protein
MGTEQQAQQFFDKYGLPNAPRFSDPQKNLYKAMELEKGTLGRLFSLEAVARGLPVFIRYGAAAPVGDPMQMPGAFLLHNGLILCAYRHNSSAARPNYLAMAQGTDPCCTPQNTPPA